MTIANQNEKPFADLGTDAALEAMYMRSQEVRAYDNALVRGMQNWAKSPGGSLFEAIRDQMIDDGVIKIPKPTTTENLHDDV